ncbi:DUF397 domain-containing protein [Streptomyces iconiensis]|uniref:DUF397 domain-containing protein n=1 Tax=Streptomyces iconiensis TaxID=1384038 RepID=A0ABT7AB93_9ACTN|nr:DUF397 domain-containing protein [Streptomyces iconiensis]MDJ1138086.1 DUF397 domain-containing protein [Streptomyces iconiensis]
MSAPPRNAPFARPPRGQQWKRSSYSTGTNNCLETVRWADGRRQAVRDSKDPGRGALHFGDPAWAAFVASVRDPGSTANGGLSGAS